MLVLRRSYALHREPAVKQCQKKYTMTINGKRLQHRMALAAPRAPGAGALNRRSRKTQRVNTTSKVTSHHSYVEGTSLVSEPYENVIISLARLSLSRAHPAPSQIWRKSVRPHAS